MDGSLVGGGFQPVSVIAATAAGIDVHAAANVPVHWTEIADNEWDFNTLAALPAGLGISFAFDGSSATMTTTVAGVWAFSYAVSFPMDATYLGQIGLPYSSFQTVTAGLSAASAFPACAATVELPAGAASTCSIVTLVGATANPYTVFPNLSIVRLA